MARRPLTPRTARKANPEGRMSLGDHLRELRRRLMISAGALLLCSVAAGFYYDEIFRHLTAPFYDYRDGVHKGGTVAYINFGTATAAFAQQISLSVFVGVIVSSPIWLYQLWAFIVPGLTSKERRTSLAFIGAIVPWFLLCCGFAYWTLPKALAVLYGFTPPGGSNIQQVDSYFSFVTHFILAFGLAFLMPVFLVGLVMIGVLHGRQMLKAWRFAVLLIFIGAAIITPTPDPVTMLLMGIPLVVLYFGAVAIALGIDKRRAAAEPDWMGLPDDQASPL